MDPDLAEIFEGITYPDDDSSGSVYEESSDNDDLSHSGNVEHFEEPVTPAKGRGRSPTRKSSSKLNESRASSRKFRKLEEEGSFVYPENQQNSDSDTDNQVFEDAKEWAANFQPPAVDDIKTPARHSSRKRRVQKPPSELRSKRLKVYYDNDYRELLNAEINDAAHGELSNDSLEPSQVGSSLWTTEEKDLLFSSLARLGRDDGRGIAVQIGTKSEPEVQEYLQLLQANITKRKRRSDRNFMIADLPAAFEIGEECCLVLERAGDALAVRQEMAEEKVEKSKWSDMWLVDERVSRLIERRRREEGGEEALDAVLPAGNLFSIKNWLELSRRVFMNPGGPREEDNWETLAEAGETPAIRATAFEDFHSLAVNITKKLLSTTLFCTMSRLRSAEYHYVKVSEITADDVEAAVNILGWKSNSSQFWLDCAKRNNLDVIDDGEGGGEEDQVVSLTYEDVERELRSSRRSRSRSLSRNDRARSSSQASLRGEDAYSSPSEVDFYDAQDFDSDASSDRKEQPFTKDSLDSSEPESPTAAASNQLDRIQRRKAAERAQEAYAEALDMRASRKEEARLWDLIEQEPPFEVETKIEEPERPTAIRDDIEDRRNWREHLEYWSPWETMKTPVPRSAFEKNRVRKSRRAKARANGTWPRSIDSANELALQDKERETGTSENDDISDPQEAEYESEEGSENNFNRVQSESP